MNRNVAEIINEEHGRYLSRPIPAQTIADTWSHKAAVRINKLVNAAIAAETERCAQVADSMNSTQNIGDRIRHGLGGHGDETKL